ncbi:NCS2 family permease [Ruficoccus amylovorans]|uniref:NCS2 family permease n=1 Tax=Ruficoccus amylovorans TaxID=1804625 RepID=A0A842HH54_9BACT|nr:NCS2 family permease [Ruficoccus amylovorans]MBC2596065.1 NCS2 family permease [Ruficoccus amylovorans]
MLERVFHLNHNGTNVRRELIAGLTTFAAMAYILALNPAILVSGGATGMELKGLITVTALAAAAGCFLMAAMTNYPIAQAPGMGINSYFASIIVVHMGIPWEGALAMVFWNGVLFFALSITGLRTRIVHALPRPIHIGIQSGIGFFIAFIGLKNSGLVVGSPITLVAEGDLLSPGPLVALAGLALIVVLTRFRVAGSIILVVLLLTVAGLFIPTGESTLTAQPTGLFSMPAGIGQTFLALDWLYPFRHFEAALPVIFTLLLLDLFDSIGTLVGLARQSGLMDKDGHMPKLGRALSADAAATVIGALLGTSTTTAYLESATGMQAGGRTGLTAVVTGLCFLVALFFTPVISIIPTAATAPALIFVGLLMARCLSDLDHDNMLETAPAVFTALLIPLCYSITGGIALGLLLYCAAMILSGRGRKLSWLTYALAGVFILFFVLGQKA